ncbi:K02A2.6-like, partial [Cordylochernes scorpioides]
MGKFTALIEKDGRSIPGEIFVVPQLMQPLLSGKASESLNLIKRLQSIEKRNSLNPFQELPKLFTGLGTLQGSYTIKLKDESQPHAIYTPRRIPIPLLNRTKEQLDQMVEKGIIEKVEQPTDWCAPMVIVPKPSSNDLRTCVDLKALNKFVKREHYPIPSVEYTLAQMGGAKLFSILDANSGFWQIPPSEESSSLTTFLTPFGRYRFKRLHFGISSAPEVFQRKMSYLLESQSGVNCHMDDIVIWGATQEEHDERLRCVLGKLQDSELTLNKEKCIFSVKEIKFLGHLITERGVLPDPNKVQAIREFPSPSSISEVRRFLGMVNFTDGLLMRNSRIYNPKSLRSKVLNSLHEGHLGIEKCRGRARSSVWWPRISQEIGELVKNCPNCIEERSNPQQPLIVSDFPSRPWEKVGIDHFYLKGKYYLLITDYYSRFPELALLEDQTTHSTIKHCKSIFARHGIPEEVRSVNGPQFGLEFKKFAKEYGFYHITSTPRFPQSNGFIESMVKNIKNQLKKGRDPYLSLLGYRTSPLENGKLPHLDEGTRVWVKDLRVPGVVLEDAGSPRSYIVNSPKGILKRNRFHLLPNPQGEKIDMEDEEMESPEMMSVYGEGCMRIQMVRRWRSWFLEGRQNLHDDERSGRPVTATDNAAVAAVRNVMEADRRVTIDEIMIRLPPGIEIGRSLIGTIMFDVLNFHKVCAIWFPRLLSENHKQQRMEAARAFLEMHRRDGDQLFSPIVTGDESWVHQSTPETKRQSMVWKKPEEGVPKKAKFTISAGKVMAIVFWDYKGVFLVDYLSPNTTVNAASTRNYNKGPKQNKDTARSAIQERTEEPSQRRDSTSEYALHASTREERPTTQDVWIIDSACTSHMTSHGEWIEHKTEERRSIQVAEEGKHIESASSGLIQATVQGKDKLNNAVTLHNVLHVPHLKGNLMSIPSVVRRGNSVLLNSEGAYTYSSDDKLIGTGNFDGNMYTLNLSRLPEATHVPNEHCLISKDNSRTAWHRRLGHPSNNKLDLILKNNLLKGLDSINGTLDECDACSLGKMTKVPYAHTDSNQESYPFEAIYVDLCGPMRINSLGGSKYFLTIVDGFSRRIFVEFLKDKLSAAEVLKKCIVKRENELNSKLKRLRTDNGTEFINKNLETFIESEGIKHELTTPYTPRSNGRVERANRTLLDKGRTLLADSQLPLHFWAEAVNTAAYLYNLTPTTIDPDTTPMEKWKGKKPSVSHIMRFGCEVFYELENHQRHKLEAKSKIGIFVGYSRCRRAYRVFDITTRVILETADIHFRENNNVISEEKQSDNNTDTDTYFFIQEDEQLDNHVLSDVDIEEPAPDTMINRQTESSGSDRPQRTRTIPKRFDDYGLATTNETIPKDYEEAIACEDKKHWENAMLEEIQNMYSHQVWELIPRPVNAKVVKSKWVFKISKDQENKTYKARLVAMGYNQIPGRDYSESFSPVIKNATLRAILSMAATKDSVIKLFDVKAAYLNGNIENTIFMEQPAGFVQDRNKVCKLNKSTYGLPQSGRSWYERFSQVLHDCGLEKLKSDPCLFKWKNEGKYFYVGIYVDDFITVSDSEDTSNRFINKLRHHLEIKDVTCKGMFLGIKIIQDKEGISLQQSHYVQQILQKYGMENCKEVSTPGSKEINLDNHIEDDNCDQHTYQEALGML